MLKTIADAIFISQVRYGLPLYCPLRLNQHDPNPTILMQLKKVFNDCLRLLTNKTWEDHASIKNMLEELKLRKLKVTDAWCDISKRISDRKVNYKNTIYKPYEQTHSSNSRYFCINKFCI